MRPIDLAREHGLSSQAVRNYEQAGILPPADRTATGYRVYTTSHAQALRTFLALVPAHGHPTATAIMTAVHNGKPDDALELIDRSHAQLLTDRSALDAVENALAELTGTRSRQRFPHRTLIGTLAHQLGLRTATLRRWERAGLLRPHRDPVTGYRVYTADDVRDAHIVRQLRRSGYLLAQITPLLTDLRTAADAASAATAIGDRRARLNTRARSMLAAAAHLGSYLHVHDDLRAHEAPLTR